MFKFKYNCSLNADQTQIILSPTKSMLVKSLAPSALIFLGLMAIGAWDDYQSKQYTLDDHYETIPKND